MAMKDKAATAAGSEGKKRGKSSTERLNKKAMEMRDWLRALQKKAATAAMLAQPNSAIATALIEAERACGLGATEVETLISRLGTLHKEKWDPKASRDVFAPGALVAVRAPEFKRFDGAYEKADLAALRVVSIHGKKAKVEIFRDNLKGESVGLVPMRWLQGRE